MAAQVASERKHEVHECYAPDELFTALIEGAQQGSPLAALMATKGKVVRVCRASRTDHTAYGVPVPRASAHLIQLGAARRYPGCCGGLSAVR